MAFGAAGPVNVGLAFGSVPLMSQSLMEVRKKQAASVRLSGDMAMSIARDMPPSSETTFGMKARSFAFVPSRSHRQMYNSSLPYRPASVLPSAEKATVDTGRLIVAACLGVGPLTSQRTNCEPGMARTLPSGENR